MTTACVVGGMLAAAAMLLAPGAADAQPTGKVPRIGTFGAADTPTARHLWEAFNHGLRDLGYVEGRSIVIERRVRKSGQTLLDLAAEVVSLGVDIIVAPHSAIAVAAKQATSTIPIVMLSGDPVADGLISSLTRPGANVTGVSTAATDIVGKQVQLLRDALPRLSRVAVLWNPGNPFHPAQLREAQAAAQTLGLQPQSVEVRAPKDFDGAFSAIVKARAEAIIVLSDGPLFSTHPTRIAELAAAKRLPAIYSRREHVEAGGLMAYGTDRRAAWRLLAVYVDKILKGARPADLPVEEPTKYEFVINLKAAKALGLRIPPSLLQQADEVIR
jgi:putative ABC transport system substrate-binding protein